MEQVGTIYIDFAITETGNPKYLSIMDLSDWLYAENLESWIEIILPGSQKVKRFIFKKDAVNSFNSNNLGITCLTNDCTEQVYLDLPDGIYTITLKSKFEGIERKRYYLKTDRTEIELAKIIVQKGFDFSEKNKLFIEYISEVRMLLDKAKAEALLGNFVEAQRYFLEVVAQINKRKNC